MTARAPSNIAVIKYWGKRNEQLILPINSSLSVTLDPDHLSATTSIATSPSFTRDRLWLNGKEVSLEGIRYQNCLRELRKRANDVKDERTGVEVKQSDWQGLYFHIVSENNFPTAAGLASSAAGFACLVYALSKLMGVVETYPGELSTFARLGSGSACRSLYGGYVKWNMGQADDGHDSMAVQVAEHSHWPDMCIIIAVVSDRQKETSSTAGMEETVLTSSLLHHRAKEVVPLRMEKMEEAIASLDFPTFAKITCADSNQFHATCLDTSPPIFYLTDTSRKIISIVERWNKFRCEPVAAYTFDAGPNAVLFVKKNEADQLLQRLLFHFPPPADLPLSRYVVGNSRFNIEGSVLSSSTVEDMEMPEELATLKGNSSFMKWEGELQYIMCTRPGRGAHTLNFSEESLIDMKTGFPKRQEVV